jgi:hypothetical protein
MDNLKEQLHQLDGLLGILFSTGSTQILPAELIAIFPLTHPRQKTS